MIALAVLMVPIVVIPLVVDLPRSIGGFLRAADYTILGVFVIEYFLKTALARNVRKHVLNPWHLLDLLVILLPLSDFLPVVTEGFARSSPLLRLLRITRMVRVVAVGGRAVDRKVHPRVAVQREAQTAPVMEIRVMDSDLENIHEDVSLSEVKRYVNSPSQTWVDMASVSESTLTNSAVLWVFPESCWRANLLRSHTPGSITLNIIQ